MDTLSELITLLLTLLFLLGLFILAACCLVGLLIYIGIDIMIEKFKSKKPR